MKHSSSIDLFTRHSVAYITANVPLHWAPKEGQHLMYAPIHIVAPASPLNTAEAYILLMHAAVKQFGADIVRDSAIDDIELKACKHLGTTMTLSLGT